MEVYVKKLSEKSRKVLRKIYLAFGATAISMLFAACYGMPMDCWESCDHPWCNVEETSLEDENSNKTDEQTG
jgi:hypothetical protein